MYKVHVGELYINIEESFVSVYSYTPNRDMIDGMAYMIYPYVYIYYKSKKPKNEVGIYQGIDGHVIIHPTSDKEKKLYSVSNIIELNIYEILDTIGNYKQDFLSEKDIEAINANTEVFNATPNTKDDPLKRVIKEVINKKQINLKLYRDRFNNEHSLNNMKSALGKTGKMSIKYFLHWCEILGLDYTLTVSDNGKDTTSMLDKDITVTSKLE